MKFSEGTTAENELTSLQRSVKDTLPTGIEEGRLRLFVFVVPSRSIAGLAVGDQPDIGGCTMMDKIDETAAQSAIRKLEQFYTGLKPDEKRVIGLIVSSSVQRAARAQAERDWLKDSEVLLAVITPEYAPTMVAELGTYVAGQAAPLQVEKRPLT
jgi:hypothetical protein